MNRKSSKAKGVDKGATSKKSNTPVPSASTAAQSVAVVAAKSSPLDTSIARKAVAALFTYEAKKQEEAPPKLIDDYAKPIIAQLQLIQRKII